MINRRVCIYDFETNGFWTPLNQPIQIAMKIVEEDGTQKNYSNYIKCDRPLSSTIESLTGITDKILEEKGIPIEQAFSEINELINVPKTLVVGHNILTFDNLFLNHRLQMYKYKPINRSSCFDTSGHFKGHLMRQRRQPLEPFGDYHSRMIAKRVKGLEYKLTDACAYYGINKEAKFHNAEADIDYTYQVFINQFKDYDNKGPLNVKILSPSTKEALISLGVIARSIGNK